MAVLIKGLEMPESCAKCRLRGGSFGTFCNVLHEYIDNTCGVPRNKRMDNCPLIPIATPHGRLIDADKALNKLANDKRDAFTKHDVWLKFSIYSAMTVIEPEGQEK